MNRREGYITTEISQGGGEAQRKEEGSCMIERGWRIPVLERMVLSLRDVGPTDSVCFSSLKQAVAS